MADPQATQPNQYDMYYAQNPQLGIQAPPQTGFQQSYPGANPMQNPMAQPSGYTAPPISPGIYADGRHGHSSTSSSSSSSTSDQIYNIGDKSMDKINARTEAIVKAGFIRKVYLILTVQMIVTCAFAAICCQTWGEVLTLGERLWESIWIPVVSLIVGIISLIAMLFVYEKVPVNFILLFVYTICWSVFVGCVAGPISGDGSVAAAFIITGIIFIGLTVLCYIPAIRKRLLIFCLAALVLCLIGSIIAYYVWFGMLVSGSDSTDITYTIYCGIYAAIFSCYIVFDTFRMEADAKINSYVLACARIYTDIVYLLLMLLAMLGGGK
eukprot:gnl/Chilomastix_cuspidata/403.p1 GENE.gnl/Chilomastix_cuspidata/403~~gnl/Chilomastix_cuspidata/403.p1  ORF type:complete len:340 (+),score=49.27 gnl/Chilomastix_cuspidata/403:51-1022(+)